jgi:hypothetical protein
MRLHSVLLRGAGAVFLVLVAPGVYAQTCAPSPRSNEADVFAIRSLSLAHTPGAPVTLDRPFSVRVGVEATLLPAISDAKATPTTCRPGKGPENVNALPAFARLRASVSFPWGLALEGALVPPIELKGMQASLASIAVSHTQELTSRLGVTTRIHALFGSLEGPITCAEEGLMDPQSECFFGQKSNDRYTPNVLGLDATVGSMPSSSALNWYAGLGYLTLRPRFQVHFVDSQREVDSTRVRVNLDRIIGLGGVSWAFGERARVTGELTGSAQDGITGRIVFDVIVRRTQ